MNWHYVEQGQQTGPVSEAQFAELVRAGKITTTTMVWREGMADWLPYGQAVAGEKSAGAGEPTPGLAPEAVCAECGKSFPRDETIPHGNVRVCAACKPAFMQKLAEGARLNTGDLNYATVPTRFAAAFLDGLILFAVNFVMSLAVGLSAGQALGTEGRSTAVTSGVMTLQLVMFAVQMLIGISYEAVMIGKYGATLGKMACKIKVVTADGGRVSYARAFGRYFAKLLSGFTCLIGYIIAFFDKPQNRALHDRLCDTRVILK